MHETTRAALIANMDDDTMRERLDTDKVLQWEVQASFMAMVRAIGPGFHPDTPGHDYITLPDGYTPEWVDALTLALVQTGQDPDLWALTALEML